MYRLRKCNKGVSPVRLMIVITAFFVLSVLFMGFDNFVGSTLPDNMKEIAPERASNINQYVDAWRIWVPAFLISFLIYTIIAGLSPRETRGI